MHAANGIASGRCKDYVVYDHTSWRRSSSNQGLALLSNLLLRAGGCLVRLYKLCCRPFGAFGGGCCSLPLSDRSPLCRVSRVREFVRERAMASAAPYSADSPLATNTGAAPSCQQLLEQYHTYTRHATVGKVQSGSGS